MKFTEAILRLRDDAETDQGLRDLRKVVEKEDPQQVGYYRWAISLQWTCQLLEKIIIL
jgi:hypothetical protein